MRTYTLAFSALCLISSCLFAVPWKEELHKVTACEGKNSSEPCYWRMAYHPEKCSEKNPCKKLILFFSGAGMLCENEKLFHYYYRTLLAQYTKDGYVVATACPFSSSAASTSPSFKQAGRIKTLLKSIRSDETVKKLWNEEWLLWSGVSQGATGPVIAMARTNLDKSPLAKGSKGTAACFIEGGYDVFELNRFLIQAEGCDLFRKRSVCARYQLLDCPEELPKDNWDIQSDSILEVDEENFSIPHWKLVECGSQISGSPCNIQGDWLPKEGIQTLCKKLDNRQEGSCTFGSLPESPHISCALEKQGVDECRLWFNARLRN